MSKATKYQLQVAVSAILLTILMLTAVKMGWAQTPKNAYRIEKFDVAGNARVEVSTSGGSITVVGKNTREVTVEMYVKKDGSYYSSRKAGLKDWDINISQRGNTIYAKAKKEKNFSGWGKNNYSISFVVYTPKESITDLNTSGGSISLENLEGHQDAKTSGGSIEAAKIEGDISLKTSGGHISFKDIEGKVYANTSGGSISAENIKGDIEAKTSGGGINLDKIAGNVSAKTSGGSIYAEIKNPKDYIELKTSGGSIQITVPKDKGYDLELGGNNVNTRLQNFSGEYNKGEIEGTINGGGIKITAKPSGGAVNMKYF